MGRRRRTAMLRRRRKGRRMLRTVSPRRSILMMVSSWRWSILMVMISSSRWYILMMRMISSSAWPTTWPTTISLVALLLFDEARQNRPRRSTSAPCTSADIFHDLLPRLVIPLRLNLRGIIIITTTTLGRRSPLHLDRLAILTAHTTTITDSIFILRNWYLRSGHILGIEQHILLLAGLLLLLDGDNGHPRLLLPRSAGINRHQRRIRPSSLLRGIRQFLPYGKLIFGILEPILFSHSVVEVVGRVTRSIPRLIFNLIHSDIKRCTFGEQTRIATGVLLRLEPSRRCLGLF
mmetsp:Transcript_39063/g.79966  ORF Transcript_39063/g.79966 Transcript_39063/m.79966 type:complete len:291 (-) Transcript_39063:443-1315(-)